MSTTVNSDLGEFEGSSCIYGLEHNKIITFRRNALKINLLKKVPDLCILKSCSVSKSIAQKELCTIVSLI